MTDEAGAPAHEGTAADGMSAGPAPAAAAAPPVRILLVEDDDTDARRIGRVAAGIETFRVEIERAVSTEEALRLLAARSFDLCLLDFWLGCETSVRLLEAMGGPGGGGPPAVVLTSLSTPDIRSMCEAAGAALFVGKERMGPEGLEALIAEALRTDPPSAATGGASTAGATVKGGGCAEEGLEALIAALASLCGPADEAGGPAAPGLGAGALPSAAPRRPDPLGLLMDLTETMRFGVFERLLSGHLRAAPDAAPPSSAEVARLVASALDVSRGVMRRRGQALALTSHVAPGRLACRPAALFFLIFELAGRASQQSASDSRIRAWLRVGEDGLAVRFSSLVPSHAAAGAVLLGPLCRQILDDHRGEVTNVPGADGSLVLSVRFGAGPPAPPGPTVH